MRRTGVITFASKKDRKRWREERAHLGGGSRGPEKVVS